MERQPAGLDISGLIKESYRHHLHECGIIAANKERGAFHLAVLVSGILPDRRPFMGEICVRARLKLFDWFDHLF
jgi:hypothetical protein